ncbi:hypothetical protein BJ742DRAFT_575090 [Cladochytrium replicatum]|nr:hypothetical protein BJ742DRAFT_575090 [Cladochytrium replicatum]
MGYSEQQTTAKDQKRDRYLRTLKSVWILEEQKSNQLFERSKLWQSSSVWISFFAIYGGTTMYEPERGMGAYFSYIAMNGLIIFWGNGLLIGCGWYHLRADRSHCIRLCSQHQSHCCKSKANSSGDGLLPKPSIAVLNSRSVSASPQWIHDISIFSQPRCQPIQGTRTQPIWISFPVDIFPCKSNTPDPPSTD